MDGELSSALFSKLVPGARVVKVFNHLVASALREPEISGGKRVLSYSGDDADAKAGVRNVIEDIGFHSVDLGSLHVGGMLVSLRFGSLSSQTLIKI